MKSKRGKRPGLRARSKNARKAPALKFTNDPHAKVDAAKLKLRAGGSKSVQKRLAAQGRLPLLVKEREELENLRAQMGGVAVQLLELRGQLAMCRRIMEANDPGNARTIFGPPLDEPPFDTAKAEGESPQAQPPAESEEPPPDPNGPDTVYS